MSQEMVAAASVSLMIDGLSVTVPKGTSLIRAGEVAGVAIPRFCDHPLLDAMGACRQCLVEIVDAGNGRGFPKPQSACTTEVADGMVVKTQATSQAAADAQRQILELLLINHPLDCPICDKGGECPLQNQALANGQSASRYDGVKRTYPKPVELSELILLDRERCVLCARCTRFADQIAGDPSIHLVERGAKQQIGIYPDQPFDSYFSGNVAQICPVGALTSADYRFSARPFDLVSTVTTCDNCAAGCQLRVDVRRGLVRRRLAGNDPAVNQEWNCDRGRFGFAGPRQNDRVRQPLVRRGDDLVPTSWPEALAAAAAGLKRAGQRVGVLPGGRLTEETAYAYGRFARTVLRTNSIDYRARPISGEETDFLTQYVVGASLADAVTYADLAQAKRVVLAMFEPEDESPIVALRLRQAVRRRGLEVVTIAPYLSRGSAKLKATLVPTAPLAVPQAIRAAQADADTIFLVGESMAQVPGAFTALLERVKDTGARWAWIPRRAGEIGALAAGCLPGLLPGGRRLDDAEAKAEVEARWGVDLPSAAGLDTDAMLAAAAKGDLAALLIGGVELADLADPAAAEEALANTFVVSLETRLSDAAALADVVLPVEVLDGISGTFLNWEHRPRPVEPLTPRPGSIMTDIRVLAGLADALEADLGFANAEAAAEDLAGLPPVARPAPKWTAVKPLKSIPGLRLATWRELLDDSRCLDGAAALRASARPVVVRVAPATLAKAGLTGATTVRLTGSTGSIDLAVVADPTMVDAVVWLPANAPGQAINAIGARLGGPVELSAVPPEAAGTKAGE